MGRIRMIGWCDCDRCYEVINNEFIKITTGESSEERSRLEFITSIEEIKELIELDEIGAYVFTFPEIIVEYSVGGSRIIDLLNEIADLFDGQSATDFISCIVWKDLKLAGGISEAGFKAITAQP